MPKRFQGQFNTKWPLIHVAQPVITEIRAIAIDQVKWLCACVMCWTYWVSVCVTLLFSLTLGSDHKNLFVCLFFLGGKGGGGN